MTGAAPFAHLSADARAELDAWVAPDDQQEALRVGYLAHLAAHPDGVAKAGPPAHLTASCLVVDPPRERVLLTLHAKAGQWYQLGGHLEADDATLAAAAAREAREESGLTTLTLQPGIVQLDRHELVGSFGRCREHLDVRYVAVAPEGVEHVVSDESLDLAWWPIDALPPESEHELRPLVMAALRHLG
ncbi:NUDIX domain-containing protein [Janibacter sp. G56]|uniref:NUDIX domain-containing protein n=1 Tax=Janibacter sp. G56 TaxID=3418717 RepID=UPI003D047721